MTTREEKVKAVKARIFFAIGVFVFKIIGVILAGLTIQSEEDLLLLIAAWALIQTPMDLFTLIKKEFK